MKRKVDIIECCGDCSNKYYIYNTLYCAITDKSVSEDGPIPKTCELPDAEPAYCPDCNYEIECIMSCPKCGYLNPLERQ